MNKKLLNNLVIVIIVLFLSMSIGYGQSNTPNPLVNLALTEDATVNGNAPAGGRGNPTDILWDPSTNDWATPSQHHEYGMAYDDIMAATKADPLFWQVVWTEPKNVNYITCSGVYGNQPQPTTGWAVQIKVEDEWQDLAKAYDGWDADTLRGAGVGIPTQTNWVWDGQLVWKGLEPIVTTGIRFTAYANPDSLVDGKESFADSLWSFAWSGRDFGSGTPKAALIQYLDYSEEVADNKSDPLVNLALLDEAVVSASFVESTYENERGQPVDILYDLVKDDYHNKNIGWGEFGYPYDFEFGYPEGPDDGFNYIVEWPVPKKINFFSWGGCYEAFTYQMDTPWAVQYWDGEVWETLIEGTGGSFWDGDTSWPYTPGVDAFAQSIWMVPEADAITTNKFRLAAWSDGFTPLASFIIRCRGGECFQVDDSENPFKAVLVQYADISDPTVIGQQDLVQPAELALHQNYPNPFNPVTAIGYQLSAISEVELSVYNLIGQKVATLVSERQPVGTYQVQWDASGLSSGVYFYELKTKEGVLTRKMMLLQ